MPLSLLNLKKKIRYFSIILRVCVTGKARTSVNKFITFGINKSATSSVQFLPKLTLRVTNLKYLGRYFNVDMDNNNHMSTLLSTIKDLMIKTDNLPCHSKCKLLLYHRFVLSKLYWHLAIADLSKTWVIDTLDNIVTSYVRKWLELPISATISSLILNKSRYDINLFLQSTKFIECQTVINNAVISSPTLDIKTFWAETSHGTNLRYDQFQNTKQVHKSIQYDHEEQIYNTLLSQDLVISYIIKNSCQNLKGLWSSVQQNLPRNISIFLPSI